MWGAWLWEDQGSPGWQTGPRTCICRHDIVQAIQGCQVHCTFMRHPRNLMFRGAAGRPARVPWLESGAPDAVPRFICDVMTEGLARQLRLCGIDARSAPVMGGRQRYQAYMELVYRATSENRIVLTADTVFLRARCAATCIACSAASSCSKEQGRAPEAHPVRISRKPVYALAPAMHISQAETERVAHVWSMAWCSVATGIQTRHIG